MKHWTLVALVIAGCFFLVYPAVAPGGYTFSPLGDPPPEGGNDFTEISFWELSPRMMLVEMLLFISPMLLFPAKLLYSFTVVPLLGYRRISRRNALDHDSRKRLYECIGQNPGISLGALIHCLRGCEGGGSIPSLPPQIDGHDRRGSPGRPGGLFQNRRRLRHGRPESSSSPAKQYNATDSFPAPGGSSPLAAGSCRGRRHLSPIGFLAHETSHS